MPQIQVPWGREALAFSLPEHWKVQQVAQPELKPAGDDWPDRIAMALHQPVAVDLRADFLRMADLAPLRVTARCLRAGRTLAVCDVEVAPWDEPARTTSVGRIQFIRTGD